MIKSFTLFGLSPAVAVLLPVVGLLGKGNPLLDDPALAEDDWLPPSGLLGGNSPLLLWLLLKRAGLCGRDDGQNCLSSRLSSCPVVAQLVRMLSRSS